MLQNQTNRQMLERNVIDMPPQTEREPLAQVAPGLIACATLPLDATATEAITRRNFIIGAGGLLGAAALGGCSAGEPAAPTAGTGAGMTRS